MGGMVFIEVWNFESLQTDFSWHLQFRQSNQTEADPLCLSWPLNLHPVVRWALKVNNLSQFILYQFSYLRHDFIQQKPDTFAGWIYWTSRALLRYKLDNFFSTPAPMNQFFIFSSFFFVHQLNCSVHYCSADAEIKKKTIPKWWPLKFSRNLVTSSSLVSWANVMMAIYCIL